MIALHSHRHIEAPHAFRFFPSGDVFLFGSFFVLLLVMNELAVLVSASISAFPVSKRVFVDARAEITFVARFAAMFAFVGLCAMAPFAILIAFRALLIAA